MNIIEQIPQWLWGCWGYLGATLELMGLPWGYFCHAKLLNSLLRAAISANSEQVRQEPLLCYASFLGTILNTNPHLRTSQLKKCTELKQASAQSADFQLQFDHQT